MSHKPVALPAMNLRDVFSINMQAHRRARGLSQEALAHEAGVDRAYMSAIERSVNSATLDMVEKIAKVLDVEPWVLLKRPRRPRRKR
jgi:transcriptional regulator with XRE-family HTH domain